VKFKSSDPVLVYAVCWCIAVELNVLVFVVVVVVLSL